MAAILTLVVLLILWMLDGVGERFQLKLAAIFLLGGLASWRWGWFLVQNIRAAIYRYISWPRVEKEAATAVQTRGGVPEVTFLVVTYREECWITSAVFSSIYRELAQVQGLKRNPRIVAVTGCDEDDLMIRLVHEEALADRTLAGLRPELVLLRGDDGKRNALARGMEWIARKDPDPDGVVVLMDGDSFIHVGLLSRVLPVFRLRPTVDAVTTNERGLVKGPRWFAEWISLRFGLRHRTMCSLALSNTLHCLTGRLSVYRASVVLDESFRRQVRHDRINHWLWGEFEMLSGDDKSTWFWLAARGKRLLYVPNALVTTVEVIKGSSLVRAFANLRRWTGNSLRHSGRAIRLGPGRLGWYCWYALVDQRIAAFTVPMGPLLAFMAILARRWEIVGAYLLWVLVSRTLHAAISGYQGRRVSFYYPPLQILSEWGICLTKLWVMFHPAKQKWANRGNRQLDTTRVQPLHAWRTAFAHYGWGVTSVTLLLGVGLAAGFLPFAKEAGFYLKDTVVHPSPPPTAPPSPLVHQEPSQDSVTQPSRAHRRMWPGAATLSGANFDSEKPLLVGQWNPTGNHQPK
jgi:glycosyltransferase Alg8